MGCTPPETRPRGAPVTFNSLQYAGFLVVVAGRALDPARAGPHRFPPCRVLRLLRRLGLAVRLAPRRVLAHRLRGRSTHPRQRRRSDPATGSSPGLDRRQPRRSSGSSSTGTSSSTAPPDVAASLGVRLGRARRSASCCRSASPSTRSSRCPTRSTSTGASSSRAEPAGLRHLRVVLPPAGRRSDRAGVPPPPPDRGTAHRPDRGDSGVRTDADRRRTVPEGGDRRRARARSSPSGFAAGAAGGAALLATYGFALQIYGDFAGYTAIARGSARLLGVELMINFDAPYASRSITEFWRRWHISLSTWLRDYLYIPLGGNRGSPRRTRTEPAARDAPRRSLARRRMDLRRVGDDPRRPPRRRTAGVSRRPAHRPWPAPLGVVTTFHAVAAAFVFFRAASLAEGWPGAASGVDGAALARLAGGDLWTVVLAALATRPSTAWSSATATRPACSGVAGRPRGRRSPPWPSGIIVFAGGTPSRSCTSSSDSDRLVRPPTDARVTRPGRGTSCWWPSSASARLEPALPTPAGWPDRATATKVEQLERLAAARVHRRRVRRQLDDPGRPRAVRLHQPRSAASAGRTTPRSTRPPRSSCDGGCATRSSPAPTRPPSSSGWLRSTSTTQPRPPPPRCATTTTHRSRPMEPWPASRRPSPAGSHSYETATHCGTPTPSPRRRSTGYAADGHLAPMQPGSPG